MSAADKPLNVRCAEAVGWTRSRLPALGFGPGPDAWRSPDGKVEGAYLPPFGDDTPEGWACTGPLVSRYRLSLVAAFRSYFCSDAEMEREVEAPTPCAAVAEWVAKFAPPQPGDGA